jgi:hypothetical protein
VSAEVVIKMEVSEKMTQNMVLVDINATASEAIEKNAIGKSGNCTRP